MGSAAAPPVKSGPTVSRRPPIAQEINHASNARTIRHRLPYRTQSRTGPRRSPESLRTREGRAAGRHVHQGQLQRQHAGAPDPARRPGTGFLHTRAPVQRRQGQPAARPRPFVGDLRPGRGRNRDVGLGTPEPRRPRQAGQGQAQEQVQADTGRRACLQRRRPAFAEPRRPHAPPAYRRHQYG